MAEQMIVTVEKVSEDRYLLTTEGEITSREVHIQYRNEELDDWQPKGYSSYAPLPLKKVLAGLEGGPNKYRQYRLIAATVNGPPVCPKSLLLKCDDHIFLGPTREEWAKWRAGKVVRKELHRLIAHKNYPLKGISYTEYAAGKRPEKLTWSKFYNEFCRIVGHPPEFKHTQKQFDLYEKPAIAIFAMTGNKKPYQGESRLNGDCLTFHREALLSFLQNKRDFENLQSMMADLRERVK
jgi:hypothetical protein